MEKHVTLVGVLNIVYRAVALIGAFVLVAVAAWFGGPIEALIRSGSVRPDEVPREVLDIIPILLSLIAAFIILVSAVGIIGGMGVLKKKRWARIVLLVVSFFNLLRIPLGTALGVYSLWVLMNDETIRLFDEASGIRAAKTAG